MKTDRQMARVVASCRPVAVSQRIYEKHTTSIYSSAETRAVVFRFCCAPCTSNFVPTFRKNTMPLTSRLNMEAICSFETMANIAKKPQGATKPYFLTLPWKPKILYENSGSIRDEISWPVERPSVSRGLCFISWWDFAEAQEIFTRYA